MRRVNGLVRGAAVAFVLLYSAAAGARSRPQVWKGDLPPEVKSHLKQVYAPEDARAYFKDRKAQEVDLNNDGVFDLIVEAEPAAPPAAADKKTYRLSVFQKDGARYRPIGDVACGDEKWHLGEGEESEHWETVVCGKGGAYRFDDKASAYRLVEDAKPQAVAAAGGPAAFTPEFQAGVDLYKSGRYAEASAKLDGALGDKPTDEMLFYAGMASLKAHTLKRARKILGELGKKNYLPAHLGLGDLAWEDGDGPGAKAHYAAWIETNPPDGDDLLRAQRRVNGEESPPRKKKAAE